MPQDSTHDQELDVPSNELMAQEEATESQGDGNSLLTALGGGSTEDEFEGDGSSTSSGGKFTPRVAIVAGILVVGGGMIYGMRQYEMKQGMEMDVEFTVSGATAGSQTQVKQLTNEQKRTLEQLRAGAGPVVESPDLDRNPVKLAEQDEPIDPKQPDETGPDIEALTRDYTKILESLNVSSIVTRGRVPVAVINQKAVVVGGVVGDYFVIREIAEDAATNNMYVKVELVGFNPAVDGDQSILHIRSGR